MKFKDISPRVAEEKGNKKLFKKIKKKLKKDCCCEGKNNELQKNKR